MKYIKFVETDDILFEHTTHKLIECCEQLNTFAATGLRGESSLADNIVNPQSKACIVENTLASVVENPRLLLGNTTSLINTSIAKKLGGANPDIISIPDFSLTLDFALNYKIALLDAVVTTELGAASSERLSGNILQEQYDSARVIYQFISYNQKELYGSLDEYYLFRRAIKHLWAVAKRKKIPLPKRLNYQIKFYRSKRTRPFCFKSNQYKKVLLDWLNDYESYFKNNLKITYPSKPILSPNPYSKISSP